MPWTGVWSGPGFAVGVALQQGRLVQLELLPEGTPGQTADDPLLHEVFAQLDAYSKNPRYVFDLPCELRGTPFQQRVWQALQTIPPGQTLTYGELARQLGSAPRAVGQACGANPLPVIYPCHRVVSASGLGGFMQGAAGALDIKRWLLQHERA